MTLPRSSRLYEPVDSRQERMYSFIPSGYIAQRRDGYETVVCYIRSFTACLSFSIAFIVGVKKTDNSTIRSYSLDLPTLANGSKACVYNA